MNGPLSTPRSLTGFGLGLLVTLGLTSPADAGGYGHGPGRAPRLFVDDDGQQCPHARFTTIQSAIDAAQDGAVIVVCQGTYDEQLDIVDKSLTIRGRNRKVQRGHGGRGNTSGAMLMPTNLRVNAQSWVALINVSNTQTSSVAEPPRVNIENLTIDGSNMEMDACGRGLFGILFFNASGEANKVVVRNILPKFGPEVVCTRWNAITALGRDGHQIDVTVKSSVVDGFLKNGIMADGAGATVDIKNNVVEGPGSSSTSVPNGIVLSRGASGRIRNNIVNNNVWSGCNIFDDELSCVWVGTGILVQNSDNVEIVDNVIGPTNVNILVRGNNNWIRRNTVFGSIDSSSVAAGILILGGTKNRIKKNRIFNHEENGIFLNGDYTLVRDNTINDALIGVQDCGKGNRIKSNKFFNVKKKIFIQHNQEQMPNPNNSTDGQDQL